MLQIILCTFRAAGTGAKFPNFIVVFVYSGGGVAAQLVTVYPAVLGAVTSSLFPHNSVQEKVKLFWFQKADN